MTGFTARCLCGDIAFASSSDPKMQANSHCDDCRRAGGSVYASLVMVPAEDITISKGEPTSFAHQSDNGTTMTKYFCPNCGSQLFGSNSANPAIRTVRVGVIEDASWFQPQISVYTSRKLPSTLLNDDIKVFDRMPG